MPRPASVVPALSRRGVVSYVVGAGVGITWTALVWSGAVGFGMATGGLLVAGSIVGLAERAVTRASARRFHPDNEAGVAALIRGELDRAARAFEPWTRRGALGVQCVARHNLALVLARRGDLRGAIELFADNERRRLRGLLRTANAVNLSSCLALLGELELAESWLAEAEERLPDGGRSERARWIVARAVVQCRRGKTAEAALELERGWPDIEGLPVFDVRSIRVLRAFMSDGGPREAGVAQMVMADARPRYPGEYGWLAAGWPEMRVFLETTGLDGHS